MNKKKNQKQPKKYPPKTSGKFHFFMWHLYLGFVAVQQRDFLATEKNVAVRQELAKMAAKTAESPVK